MKKFMPNDIYEKVISEYIDSKNITTFTNFVDNKFKGKSISFSTVCNARTELFDLMIYFEKSPRYCKEIGNILEKTIESIYVDGDKICYKNIKLS